MSRPDERHGSDLTAWPDNFGGACRADHVERACIPITSDVKLESDVDSLRAETRAAADAIKERVVQADGALRHSSIRWPWYPSLRQRQNALLGGPHGRCLTTF